MFLLLLQLVNELKAIKDSDFSETNASFAGRIDANTWRQSQEMEDIDAVLKKKNAYVVMFEHEKKKKDCDLTRLFVYAKMAAENEMAMVDLQRRKGIEDQDVLINLYSAASLMLEACAACQTEWKRCNL